MRTPITPELVQAAARVRLVVIDADGALTDGMLAYTARGDTVEHFHARDATALRLLAEAGIVVAAVTARSSGALGRFGDDFGLRVVRDRDRLAAVERLARDLSVGLEEICFLGYDLLDLPALSAVGLGIAVGNAHVTVRAGAQAVTTRNGGRGALRELADFLLRGRRTDSPRNDFGVVIPARMASTRLPGKPLLDLGGRPMIVHVVENARRSGASFVVVATDDERIARAVKTAGAEAILTSADHTTGTDRVAEVVERLGLDDDAVVVNVQGDEPLLDPRLIDRVGRALLLEPDAEVATLATPIVDMDHVHDPNVVKVIVNHAGLAVAFSRAPIPWVRDAFTKAGPERELPRTTTFLRHVGVYAYLASALKRVAAHPPVSLEKAEALEQLRILWLGMAIHVSVVDEAPAHGVDTAADLEAAERALRKIVVHASDAGAD